MLVVERAVYARNDPKRTNTQARKNYVAITADVKTKDFGVALRCTAFIKFRGPQALKVKLPVINQGC